MFKLSVSTGKNVVLIKNETQVSNKYIAAASFQAVEPCRECLREIYSVFLSLIEVLYCKEYRTFLTTLTIFLYVCYNEMHAK